MRYAIDVPNFGDFADPRVVADLARRAEDVGWDGLFVWDHVTHTKSRLRQIAEPQSETVHFDHPLPLDCGTALAPFCIAYQTYGTLNAARTNAFFICHALTGDAHAAGHHGDPSRPGWWDNLIGPGKPLDTDRLFVICANLLGGCQGTPGPS